MIGADPFKSSASGVYRVIKICGLRTPAAVDAALGAGADMVGFVFFAPSPRHVDFATVRGLGARVGGRARKVALSVDADDEALATIIAAVSPDLLQLHGKETPARVGAVKARFALPVIKAIPVETADDLACVPAYAAVADWLLFDARAPRDATRPGGLGKAFDWRLLKILTRVCRSCFQGVSILTMWPRRSRSRRPAPWMCRPVSSARRAIRTPT